MTPVILDNIIFSLQQYGGISVVWNELLQRARTDKMLAVTELDYRQHVPMRFMERYRVPAYIPSAPAVFHSSYFRVLPLKGVHNVTTVHDLTYHFYRHGLAKAVHLWEEERALKLSEAIICISENTKRDLLRFYPWYPEEQITIAYNGVSDEFYPMKPVKKKGFLLYVGNTQVAYKRYDVAQAVSRLTGIELVTASCVTRAELNQLYNEALCLLYPSDYEGFGLPVLEAQKAGCPVIAQNTSSIPEVIGPNGLMVEHGTTQHMAQEMADIVLQLKSRSSQSVIDEGIANTKRFSWDKSYEQVKKTYENIYYHHHL